ncbi:ATP-binding cassette domain-containing protein [Micromonospora fluostatini]|uniref:ATP-binding cassette domain-containing protein n=1 Tax=Micromonospora sp. JCM 30529 TaxID=3421643 RepID=UPI003D17E41C
MRRLFWQAVGAAPGPAMVHVGLAVTAGVLTVAEPAAFAAAVNATIAGQPAGTPLLVLALVLVGGTLVRATSAVAAGVVAVRATRLLRTRLLRHALRLGTPHRQPFPVGDLVSRVSTDAGQPGALLPVAVQVGLSVAVGLAGFVALAVVDGPTALVLAAGVAVSAVVVRAFVLDLAGPLLRYREAAADLAARFVDACRGARTIRASGTVQRETDRVLRPLAELRAAATAQWTAQRRLVFRVSVLQPLLEATVLAVAGIRLYQGHIAAGDLVAVLGYTSLVLGLLDEVDTVGGILHVRAGTRRVHEVLAHPEAVPEPAVPQPPPSGPAALRLVGATVRHDAGTVLDAVTLEIPPGGRVAVVGRSGAGKSALCGLVGRLADPDAGQVLLGDVDLRAIASAELRRRVVYAFERPELFGATVHEALSACRPSAGRAEVVAAARAARADHFVRCLPDGYDTPLSGLALSGGELQRLGIARALVGDADLVVLDDATSSVDTATEAELHTALRRAWAGRTAVLVAHRAATAAAADLVVWLDGGRLRAYGPHRSLWRDEEYRRVFGQPVRPEPERIG